MSSNVISVGEDDFDRVVLESKTLVLVDFWAVWCSPCIMITPVLEELSTIYAQHLLIARVDIDKNRGLVSRYHVCSLPLLMLFNRGQIQSTCARVVCLGELRHIIQRTLAAVAA